MTLSVHSVDAVDVRMCCCCYADVGNDVTPIQPNKDCFLLNFKKKNKVTSVELMQIWQHYDEDNDGTIEKIELQG